MGLDNFVFLGDGCSGSSLRFLSFKAPCATTTVVGKDVAFQQVYDFLVLSLYIIKTKHTTQHHTTQNKTIVTGV